MFNIPFALTYTDEKRKSILASLFDMKVAYTSQARFTAPCEIEVIDQVGDAPIEPASNGLKAGMFRVSAKGLGASLMKHEE